MLILRGEKILVIGLFASRFSLPVEFIVVGLPSDHHDCYEISSGKSNTISLIKVNVNSPG